MTHKYTDWMIWNGGSCPVPEGTRGQWQRRCENRVEAEQNEPAIMHNRRWAHMPDKFDIIAYRTLIEPKVDTVRMKTDTFFYCIPMHILDVPSYRLTDDPDGVALTYTDGRLSRIFWEADE